MGDLVLGQVLKRGETLGFVGISGSHAYGTNHAESDVDYRGCFLAPTEQLLGLDNPSQQYEMSDPDLVFFEAGKFLHQATQGNPNILEVMFLPRYLYTSYEGEKILSLNKYVISELALSRYQGFAVGQWKKYEHSVQANVDNKYARRIKKLVLHMFRILEQGHRLKTEGWLYVETQQRDRLFELADAPKEEVEREFERDLAKFKESDSVLRAKPSIDFINRRLIEIRQSMGCFVQVGRMDIQ